MSVLGQRIEEIWTRVFRFSLSLWDLKFQYELYAEMSSESADSQESLELFKE